MFFPILAFLHIQKIEFLISKHQHTHTHTETHTFFSHSLFFSKAFFWHSIFRKTILRISNISSTVTHTNTLTHTCIHTHYFFSCFSTPFQLVTHLWNSFPFQIQFLTKNKFTRNFFHFVCFFSWFIYQFQSISIEINKKHLNVAKY